MTDRLLRAAVTAAATLSPSLAFAHPGHLDATGFAHGFLHPVSGMDHVLAMVMVGVLAFQLGGRAVWAAPATFVAVMAAGGALGASGAVLPFAETAIALSVVVLGVAVAFDLKAPVAAVMAMVGLFAVFHGYAHGAEAPENAGGAAYAAGFMLATSALHAAGVGFGFLIGRLGRNGGGWIVRAAGGAAAIAGVALLAGAALQG